MSSVTSGLTMAGFTTADTTAGTTTSPASTTTASQTTTADDQQQGQQKGGGGGGGGGQQGGGGKGGGQQGGQQKPGAVRNVYNFGTQADGGTGLSSTVGGVPVWALIAGAIGLYIVGTKGA